jgi:hypothetical protein
VVLEKSGPKVVSIKRGPNGELVGMVSDAQGTELKQVSVVRVEDGSMTGTVTEAPSGTVQ